MWLVFFLFVKKNVFEEINKKEEKTLVLIKGRKKKDI